MTARLTSQNTKIEFTVTYPVGFWVGIGFGESMKKTPVFVLDTCNTGDIPKVIDAFSEKRKRPTPNHDNRYHLKGHVDTTYCKMTVTRPLNITRDNNEVDNLALDQPLNCIYAYNEGPYKYHGRGNRGGFIMKISSSTGSVTFGNDLSGGDVFYKIHGIIMYITWSILTFISLVSGRYMRHMYKFRMIIHASIGTLIMSNTVIIVVLALTTYKRDGELELGHSGVGIAVLVVSILEFMGGITVRQTYQIQKWKTKWAMFSKVGHQVFGLAIILLSNFQVVTGLINYDSPVKGLIYAHFAVYLVLLGIIEVLYRIRYKYKEKGIVQKEGLPTVTHFHFNAMLRSGRKLVLFNNHIVDVESFMDEHPGTKFLISENIGCEIGKYFYGAYTIDNDMKPHTHSSYAAELIEKMTIGKLAVVNDKANDNDQMKANSK